MSFTVSFPVLSSTAKVDSPLPPVMVKVSGSLSASDATIAMELGCDGVLVNTAIAEARNPIMMAEAMKYAVIAGRKAFKAERMKKRRYGSPSSPQTNLI